MDTITVAVEEHIKDALVSDFDNGFTALVKEYQPGIHRGATRLTRSPEDARDVAQDTFVRAYSALKTYDPDRIHQLKMRPWLWTITLNLCRNRWRKGGAETSLLDHDDPTSDGESFDDIAWRRRLEGLNANQRNAVVMRHVLDMPISEIATVTSRPEGTVKADISRGLDRLRTTMEAENHNG
jgi:RNA polymerase sigma-70 factor (ECF subfamily)